MQKLQDFISFQIPLFEREGKTYLTIAIGCTGGRHRSVVIADYLQQLFPRDTYDVYINHRDLKKQLVSTFSAHAGRMRLLPPRAQRRRRAEKTGCTRG